MDDEVKGKGVSANYKYRMNDVRIGRFFATDPLEHIYTYNSPYAFSENRVIDGVELEGLEYYAPVATKYKHTKTATTDEYIVKTTANVFISLYNGVAGIWNYAGDLTDPEAPLTGLSYGAKKLAKDVPVALEAASSTVKRFMNDPSQFATQDNGEDFLAGLLGYGLLKILKAPVVKTPTDVDAPPPPASPTVANMTNKQVRDWYNAELDNMNVNVKYTEANAKSIVSQRSKLKQAARDKMSDRDAAAKLDKDFPIRDYDYYKNKAINEGLEGDAIYERIINSGNKSNADVNKKYE